MAGCSGGGGGSSASSSPVMNAGTASGRLIVPPNHVVEVEPNDAIGQAQTVVPTVTVSGDAAEPDPGFVVPGTGGTEVEDLYNLAATTQVQIVLTIATDDLLTNDLDLLLMDSAGNVLDISEGQLATEVIDTPGTGQFLVGVRALRGAGAYALSIVPQDSFSTTQVGTVPSQAAFVPGDILVKLKSETTEVLRGATGLAVKYGLSHTRASASGATLMRVSTRRQSSLQGKIGTVLSIPTRETNALQALTLDTIRTMRSDPAVAYVEPNFIRQPTVVPDDEFFGLQWHYEVLNLLQAWEITTGSESIIVAVIDTGVLVDHPDLQARLIEGYDFISHPTRANDGDGLDPDPNDPGDAPEGSSSSFHGTHVAGIIGAVTNNATGVAGVTWQTRVMPLRVSGVGGATDADIAQAIRYAAGLSNDSGTIPTEPAHIINLSLSGPGFGQTLHEAIQAAVAQGVIVVAAAGNQSTDTLFYPAAHEGVISVAAVDRDLDKAPYSNFGSTIDVAAPGGDVSADRDRDGFIDGVLSTSGNDAGHFLYDFLAGTSMASPQVASVIALMLAVNPHLTRSDIEQLLAGTHPDTPVQITMDLGQPGRDDLFGHGLIDASEAVLAAQAIPGGGAAPVPTGPILGVSTTSLHFKNSISTLPIDLTNAGSGTLQVMRIVPDASWLKIMPASGTAPFTSHVIVDRTDLAAGVYTATIQITSDASEGNHTATVGVTMEVSEATTGNIGTAFVVLIDVETSNTVAQVETNVTQHYAFTTPDLPPGTYRIVAGTDRDQDGTICETGDACGVSLDPVSITAGQHTAGIRLVVDSSNTTQSVTPVLLP